MGHSSIKNSKNWEVLKLAYLKYQRKKKLIQIVSLITIVMLLDTVVLLRNYHNTKAEESQTMSTEEVRISIHKNSNNVKPNHIKNEDNQNAYILAKLVWGEARGVKSTTEKSAVIWCVLNRVDSKDFPDTIEEVAKQYNQFDGYKDENPVEEGLMHLANDVLSRWNKEKDGYTNVGRTLPQTYVFFEGDGERNWFFEDFNSYTYWDWSLESPYEC